MKRFLKIFLIVLGSLLILIVLTTLISSWIVFTPERITPIVRNQAEKFIDCETGIGEVDISFFSDYPNLGLKLSSFTMINPVRGSASDTLVKVEELIGIVDARAWWKSRELVLIGLELKGGTVNVFADSLGNVNYDVFVSGEAAMAEEPDKGDGGGLPVMDIRKIVLDKVNLHFNDQSLQINTLIRDLAGFRLLYRGTA